MIIEITPARATQLLYLLEDWYQPFAIEDSMYQRGYKNCAKHVYDILDITEEDLKEIVK